MTQHAWVTCIHVGCPDGVPTDDFHLASSSCCSLLYLGVNFRMKERVYLSVILLSKKNKCVCIYICIGCHFWGRGCRSRMATSELGRSVLGEEAIKATWDRS